VGVPVTLRRRRLWKPQNTGKTAVFQYFLLTLTLFLFIKFIYNEWGWTENV
jgi:hypothetical protein